MSKRPTVADLLKRIEALEAEVATLRAARTAPVYPVQPWDLGYRPWQPPWNVWCGSVTTTTGDGPILWNEAA